MSLDVTMRAVGDWNKKMDVPLHNALQSSIVMTGRSGRQACEWAIVLMSKSARASTPEAKKDRPIKKGEYGDYVVRYKKRSRAVDWKWMFSDQQNKNGASTKFQGKYHLNRTWEEGKAIPRRGLAKRSWFWGLKGLSSSRRLPKSKDMPGVATLEEVYKMASAGFILTNKLKYIKKIMPAGFENKAAKSASQRIMTVTAKKMEKEFGMVVPRLAARRQKSQKRRLEREFRRRQAA